MTKEIKPVHPKGNQSWIFIGRTDAEAEAPILWPPNAKSRLTRNDPDAGKDWRQEEKGMTEDKMVGWHYQLKGTWDCASSGSWWWAAKPGVLHSMGSQRVRHDWGTELNWSHLMITCLYKYILCFEETLCDPMNRSTQGLPVHHQLLEFTQTHVSRVGDAIQPSHPLSSPSPPAPNPSQHQNLFQWVNSLHEVAKVLEFQL